MLTSVCVPPHACGTMPLGPWQVVKLKAQMAEAPDREMAMAQRIAELEVRGRIPTQP